MKFCYCDESGTGDEPFAVLAGVVVDSHRMHLTKSDWQSFLVSLSEAVGKDLQELHTRHFYRGSGVWKGISGPVRAEVISLFLRWFQQRKHHVVFSVIEKEKFEKLKASDDLPAGLGTIWRAMGFHVTLSLQKRYMREKGIKGNTVMIFDEEVKEKTRFQDLVLNPPEWSDDFYKRSSKKPRLCQIVDAPYFADSKNVSLIQSADFIAYFVRRYVEIRTGTIPAQYVDEEERLEEWFDLIKSRLIAMPNMYPKTQRCDLAEMYWNLAPECIRG